MDQFGLNSYYADWLKNYLFIKWVIQIDTNLIQTHLYLIQTREKHILVHVVFANRIKLYHP